MVKLLTGIRTAGNHFFTQQKFPEARRKYRKGNRYYNLLHLRFDKRDHKSLAQVEGDVKKLETFSVFNHTNLAAVELKLHKYFQAKHSCSEVGTQNLMFLYKYHYVCTHLWLLFRQFV